MIAEHAVLVLYLAFATFGLAAFVRALPWPKSWLAVKPLACPVCMVGWSGFAVLGYAHAVELLRWELPDFVPLWFALIGVGAPLFKKLYPPDFELPLP